jgi:hypothetical protein
MSVPSETEKLLNITRTAKDLLKEAYTQSVAFNEKISETPAGEKAISVISEIKEQLDVIEKKLT